MKWKFAGKKLSELSWFFPRIDRIQSCVSWQPIFLARKCFYKHCLFILNSVRLWANNFYEQFFFLLNMNLITLAISYCARVSVFIAFQLLIRNTKMIVFVRIHFYFMYVYIQKIQNTQFLWYTYPHEKNENKKWKSLLYTENIQCLHQLNLIQINGKLLNSL